MKLLMLAVALAALGSEAPVQPLAVGDSAPGFSLPSSTGKTVNLSDFAGKQAVVLAFYPKAFTGG